MQSRAKQELAGRAAETAEQKKLIGYSSGKSRRELDVMHRVMRRGRACLSGVESRTELAML